ncbi:Pol protein [Phytophthora palmivora]|uniref:Pol protein n=1 Tax=Phytophthora palmivora TaxID=4796 RepID=A0A2P4YRT9_9STRA|nr:Pol protein [Phytophthora palmivora]
MDRAQDKKRSTLTRMEEEAETCLAFCKLVLLDTKKLPLNLISSVESSKLKHRIIGIFADLGSFLGSSACIYADSEVTYCGEVVLRNRKITGVLLHTAPELPTNGGGTPIFREVT